MGYCGTRDETAISQHFRPAVGPERRLNADLPQKQVAARQRFVTKGHQENVEQTPSKTPLC